MRTDETAMAAIEAETASVLDQITRDVAALFGDSFPAGAIRVDVDVFDGGEQLVAGRHLDSMDLVQIMATVEERFDISLAPILTGDQPMTLEEIARHISRTMP